MSNDEILQFYAGYDEDDEDCGLDEFLDKIEAECESFEERLKRYNITLLELRRKYADFAEWYGEMINRIGAECKQKAVVCRALCRYIREHGFDDDIIKLWCICVSEYYDYVIAYDFDNDEQSILFNFLTLESDMQDFMYRIKNEDAVLDKFNELVSSIQLGDKPVGNIDSKRIYHELSLKMGINGPELEANLENAAADICRSPQLYKLAPLVFYSLLKRQEKRMTDTSGYEPNYKALFNVMVRCIDRDNGKNISAINSHIDMYKFFKQIFRGQFDEYLCDMGFSAISNISQCSLVSFDGITRPLYYQLRDECFTVFPNGLLDNPVVVGADVHHDDVANYQYYDDRLPPKYRILGKVRRYIAENEQLSEDYISLIINGKTDNCMPIVLSIFSGADIGGSVRKPELMDVIYAVIMDELQQHINDKIYADMLDMIGIFKAKGETYE